ncbi:MAG: DUF3570 domain-containing protein [Proteobacteria bacterium]|nr:DUF3570 domain-containing protein [Pseudomonadota bacterium]
MSPQVHVAAALDKVTVETTYAVDAWTGASVDVVTAATAAIHEVRNEVTAVVGYDAGIAQLAASYRYSTEPDYGSHGVVLGGKRELAHKNTTVGLDLLLSRDTVGRAGDPQFEEALGSVGARAAITQILDRRTLAELAWETTRLDGFQASPYRFVAIGGEGTCATGAPYCVPESVPSTRTRNAATLRARRALDGELSAGVDYRFYFDSWGLRSHTVQPDLTYRISSDALVAVRYRYYTQNEARFYRPRYLDLMDTGHVTRDRKLSASYAHEIGANYLHRFEVPDHDLVIVAGLRASASYLEYLEFVGLRSVYAYEATALFGLELD